MYAQSGWIITIQPGPTTNLSFLDKGNGDANAFFANNMFHGERL
jgi:hypothetical protein